MILFCNMTILNMVISSEDEYYSHHGNGEMEFQNILVAGRFILMWLVI